MLLLFADGIRDALPELLRGADTRAALSNLALAHREGKHIVSGPAALLGALAQTKDLPEEVRGTYREIKAKHSEQRAIRDAVRYYASIEPEGEDFRCEVIGSTTRFHVSLSWFDESAKVQASRLVAEDRDDALIYCHAAQAFAYRHIARRGISPRFQSYGGGGSSVEDALRDHAREGLTVAVVDGDVQWDAERVKMPTRLQGGTRHPAIVEGGTASKARRAVEELASKKEKKICDVYVLPCHEIENLIPPSLVRDCLHSNDPRDLHDRCDLLHSLGFLGAAAPLDRLDLKKGLCGHDITRCAAGHPKRRFLAGVFADHRRRVPEPSAGWCDDLERCEAAKREECRCVLFDGLNDVLLPRVARLLNDLTPQKVAEYLFTDGAPSEPAWSEIGRLLFSWGCAYKRLRS